MLGKTSPSTIIVTTTSPVTGRFGEIYALANSTFTDITSGNGPGGTDAVIVDDIDIATSIGTLAAGQSIRGYFVSVTLATGKVVLYSLE